MLMFQSFKIMYSHIAVETVLAYIMFKLRSSEVPQVKMFKVASQWEESCT